MNHISKWVFIFSAFTIFTIHYTECVETEVRHAMINFLTQLSSIGSDQPDPSIGWNISSDPCRDGWPHVDCDRHNITVRKIRLDKLNLSGVLDAESLCGGTSLASNLTVLSLNFNNITGQMPEEIAKCQGLELLRVDHNQMTGDLPKSLSKLSNLKRLEVSNNLFTGGLPGLARISSLKYLLVQGNQFAGKIPKLDFSNLEAFNVSYNNFSGRIPKENSFDITSFIGNAELCGEPLPNKCPKSGVSTNQMLMFLGYALLALALALLIAFKLTGQEKAKAACNGDQVKKPVDTDSSSSIKMSSIDFKPSGISKEAMAVVRAEMNSSVSQSLIVLSSPVVKGLNFEDLLKAPAELLGRGKTGSVYRCILEDGTSLAVKRMKDWTISREEFKRRMQKIDLIKHVNVLPLVAFYSSKQEKLLVYDYQPGGSLVRLIQGTQLGQEFDWGSRLAVAAKIAEALAFMHQELNQDAIAHGNLKSSNILFNKDMEPCISEYGLMLEDKDQNLSSKSTKIQKQEQLEAARPYSTFSVDIYGFGVILLELLTGKIVQTKGLDLARWVHSVVREEWTVEVFDKALISEGASQERMLNLLSVAIRCVNASPEARPSIEQVVASINFIKEDEEQSAVRSEA